MRIVLAGGFLADYPQGGGHWTAFLQYLHGLDALAHDVFWLELFTPKVDPIRNQQLIEIFFERFDSFNFRERCGLLVFAGEEQVLNSASAYGISLGRIQAVIASADLL